MKRWNNERNMRIGGMDELERGGGRWRRRREIEESWGSGGREKK